MRLLFLMLLATFAQLDVFAQSRAMEDYVGQYIGQIDSSSRVVIRKENGGLTIEFVGQGRVSMLAIGADRFSVSRVKPKSIIEFKRDSQGKTTRFVWNQPLPQFRLPRIGPVTTGYSSSPLTKYTGNYRFNSIRALRVRVENGHLTVQSANERKFPLTEVSQDHFVFEEEGVKLMYEFVADKNGNIQTMKFTRSGSPLFVLTNQPTETPDVVYGFSHPNGFTRADTLRGKLTPLRTCYDVLFYDLNVSVDIEKHSVKGNNKIRFKAMSSFEQMQLDLFANMKIEKILYHDTPLSFTREYNAVFVHFPVRVEQGRVEEIDVVYSGTPQTPDASTMAGGIFWLQDKGGEPWIETVTQGSGASLWWPCKDHLSDKPDSMKISVTVPHGLTDISNGRLLRKTELPGNVTRFDWYVSYPITPYCVVMNIGNYAHYSDRYVSGTDTLLLHHYCMPQDIQVARKIFEHTQPLIALFEKSFGKYPFWRDGFTAMQSIYPMEHQSAVSIGSIFNPFNSEQFDSLDAIRTLWHESAHEWWGNSITVKDMADLWIHEAFATYAEVMAYESLLGQQAMKNYLKMQKPGNKEPIIGKCDVNDFRLGDMYSKGALMLHTLRNLIDDDAAWLALLRSIQTRFAYQTITTDDLVHYINQKTHKDYTRFFLQYLSKASIPQLELRFEKRGGVTLVNYRWKSVVDGFDMPVKVTTAKNTYAFIYPITDWQGLELKDMKPRDFKAATDQFYVEVVR